jgi:hypothetical protein
MVEGLVGETVNESSVTLGAGSAMVSQAEDVSCACCAVRLVMVVTSCVGCGACMLDGVGAQLAMKSKQSTSKNMLLCFMREGIGWSPSQGRFRKLISPARNNLYAKNYT